MKDFMRVSAATPRIRVADAAYNRAAIADAVRNADRGGIELLVLPELCLTGYTCGDLFLQERLLADAETELGNLARETADCGVVFCGGLPFRFRGKLYNTAAVLCKGKVLALVPKRNIPNYGEFYELRHFSPWTEENTFATFADEEIPFGNRFVFENATDPLRTFGVEICEDLWVGDSPSVGLAANGAAVILNLSASDETVGKADYRRTLVSAASAKLSAAYVYADAGEGESTTDMVFAGHDLIYENGVSLAETPPFGKTPATADVDLSALAHERLRMNTFRTRKDYDRIRFELSPRENAELLRKPVPLPFVPSDPSARAMRCEEILSIQTAGLLRRMEAAHAKSLVIGISGGLDSCLALLVAVRAADAAERGRESVLAVSMPCFGTTSRTRNNAKKLCAALGVSFREISIRRSVSSHFADIGQDPENHNVVYENAQARERTQVLMDLANGMGGLVVGTGDLSELALGWATYNGDHMSMYGVNAGVPKTLVRHIVCAVADRAEKPLAAVLLDILDTPVSPELLPAENGKISQKTEDLVGPYELHDFFLFHFLRWGAPPKKIFFLARLAFPETPPETIKKWLITFCRRFFAQQFKRSCLPDGPKIGSVSLSPRGDFRMPSDACAESWIREAESL